MKKRTRSRRRSELSLTEICARFDADRDNPQAFLEALRQLNQYFLDGGEVYPPPSPPPEDRSSPSGHEIIFPPFSIADWLKRTGKKVHPLGPNGEDPADSGETDWKPGDLLRALEAEEDSGES